MTVDTAPPPQAVVGRPDPWPDTCADLARLLDRALAEHGVTTGVEVAVLGVRDELTPAPAPTPARARAEERPGPPAGRWPVPVHLYGHQVVVGPFPAAHRSAPCPRCLVRRWQAVRSTALRDALELGGPTVPSGNPPWALPFAADTVAAVVAAGLAAAAREEDRYGAVYLVDLERLHVARYPLVPDSGCPACGPILADCADAAWPMPVAEPKPAPEVFRGRPIDAYDLPEAAFVNPVTGMLGARTVPDLGSVSSSATLGCFTVRSDDYLDECFWGGHTSGYGVSRKVGLLEGLERFAGMRPRAKATVVHASYSELGDRALDPRLCGGYSEDFHRREPGVRPFTMDRPIPWVWGYSLRDRRPLLVPEILAYFHTEGQGGDRFVQDSSSGCASGGGLAEAAYHGLMEAVERDAFLIAWYAQAELPELDPYSSTRRETREMVDRLALYGYRVRLFDTRITFPVPVVTAVAQRRDGGLGTLAFGAGAGLDPEAAVAGGLCEIATDAVKLGRMAAHEYERLHAMTRDHARVGGLHDHPLVYGLPQMARHADFLLAREREPLSLSQAFGTGGPPRTPVPAPSLDLVEDLRRCVEMVAAAGFDVVVVDQTAPEQHALGLHAVKVIVPGLVPIDFGWHRQRARHLPRVRTALRQAGLRDRDLRDDELNPAPHPFP
ncbi:TOMM precursor leader peptide-binding protein [Streptacidiphilus melanogenes]|uniref:TOMM precursor leader peptide-binding protein n=1 Tax=Streptacidiphilus melanogenes TaxID=411235 RepID=UPI000A079100|nr:TOMM precursor leader peptide-binding protein [Streptacidiphilus melanogenes]